MSKTASTQNSGAFLETMEDHLLEIAIYIQIGMDMDQCQPMRRNAARDTYHWALKLQMSSFKRIIFPVPFHEVLVTRKASLSCPSWSFCVYIWYGIQASSYSWTTPLSHLILHLTLDSKLSHICRREQVSFNSCFSQNQFDGVPSKCSPKCSPFLEDEHQFPNIFPIDSQHSPNIFPTF